MVFIAAAACAVVAATEAKLPDVPEIVLQAKPTCGHLQDVCFDGEKFLYWAHTKELYKTDLTGKVLAKAAVDGHHAGLDLKNGRLFVAVCRRQGVVRGKPAAKFRLAIGEYDADTLAHVKTHETEVNDRAGSLAVLEDGCLRPPDIKPTQVRFHHLDKDFKPIKSHVLDDVPVRLGIEVVKRRGSTVYLDTYGAGHDRKMLGFDAIRLDADFREAARGKLGGATGLVFDGDHAWTGWSRLDKEKGTYTSKIVRKPMPTW